ncbi:MAG TPA: collagen-binding domain-containing protein [Planctomycetota bacterium]
MNIRTSRKETGSALILSLIAILIMAGIGGALFSLAISEQRTTQNASRADAVYYVAEAGIDDAVNKLKAYAATAETTAPYELPDAYKSADFAVIASILKDASGNTYNEITGTFQSGTFTVTVTPAYQGIGNYKVRSIGEANGEKKGIETWLSAANVDVGLGAGLFGKVFMYAGGNVTTDGYKSKTGAYATQAVNKVTANGKDYLFANMTGSIGSNGAVQVGDPSGTSSVVIYGNATSGPGEAVTVNTGSTVFGTTTPAATAKTIPSTDFTVPATATTIAGISGSKNIGTVGTTTVLSTTLLESKSGSVINVSGDVILYVSGNVTFHSKSTINIAAGGSLKIYQSSSTAKLDINAQAVMNVGMDPSAFGIFSNVATGVLNGGADFYGTIYAPNTDMTINGNSALYGSTVASTIKITGTADFHYDEDLAATTTPVITWSVKSYEQFIVSYQDLQ